MADYAPETKHRNRVRQTRGSKDWRDRRCDFCDGEGPMVRIFFGKSLNTTSFSFRVIQIGIQKRKDVTDLLLILILLVKWHTKKNWRCYSRNLGFPSRVSLLPVPRIRHSCLVFVFRLSVRRDSGPFGLLPNTTVVFDCFWTFTCFGSWPVGKGPQDT